MTGYRMVAQMVAVAIASLALAIPARVSAQGNNANPPHGNQGGNTGGNQDGNRGGSDNQQAVACPPMDDMSGSSQPAVFKRVIADLYERDGKSRDENLKNVSVTIHFSDFKIGPTHAYRGVADSPYNPDGAGKNGRETVYPVKTTYLVCEDHPGSAPTGNKGEIVTVLHEAMTYSCFRDDAGDWRCNQTGGKQGQPERTAKK